MTESRSGSHGKRREAWARERVKNHEGAQGNENFGGGEYFHHLNCGYGFMHVYVWENFPNCTV